MTEHEELLMLREQLKTKEALLAEKENIILQKDEIITQKDELIRKKDIQIENLTQALLHARKKMFGASSEASAHIEGQLCLFEDVEKLAEKLLEDQKKNTVTVKEYKRTPRKPGVRAEMLSGLPKEIEEYIINPEDTCSECGAPLKIIGKEVVRTEVEYQPAKLIVKQIVRQIAKCTKCGTEESDNPKDHFQKAAVPSKLLSHTIATPSLVAHILYQKFVLGVPLYRIEKDLFQMGLVLPRPQMSHWVIRCSEEWFSPIYWRIHQKLVACEILHMDETRIQCNKEPNRKASSQSWMWVIQSAACEFVKGTFFYYTSSRAGDIPKELLKHFSGYLTTDAYSGYEKVEGIKRNLCWSHLRRYFIESIPLDNNGKEIPGSKGAEAREYINLLFKLEDEMKDLSPEERKNKRQVASRAMLDAFWSWVDETSAKYTTNEKLKTALGYAQNQKHYLETFLEDGRLVISNNLCEAHIRPFATARKAWLFADTPKGAFANGILYTLTETAKQNDLNVFNYLDYILKSLPNIDFANHPDKLDEYLPWSEQLPAECRLTVKTKKQLKK